VWSPTKQVPRRQSDEMNINPEAETALRALESEKHLVEGI
jgi:hypothetical protein